MIGDGRRRVLQRGVQAQPTGSWLDRLICRLIWHQVPPSPDAATWIYDPETHRLVGMLCWRCGGLIK